MRNLLLWEGSAGKKRMLVCSGGSVGGGPAVSGGSSLTVIPVTP